MELDRRRRKLLRPVAGMSHVPVTVGETFQQSPEMASQIPWAAQSRVDRLKQEEIAVTGMGLENVELLWRRASSIPISPREFQDRTDIRPCRGHRRWRGANHFVYRIGSSNTPGPFGLQPRLHNGELGRGSVYVNGFG